MIKSQVDTELITIRNTIYQMSSNTHLKDYLINYNNLDRFKIISVLNSYHYNSFVSEIILYKRNSDKLLSTDCEYTIDEFINTYYRYNEWTEYEFKQYINNLEKDSIRSPEYITSYKSSKKKYTTLSYSFPKFTKDFSSTIFLLIEESSFHSLFNKFKYLNNETIIVMNNNKKIISSYKNNISYNNLDLIYDYCLENNSFTYIIDNKKYHINSIKSASTNLTYISLCPTSNYMKKIKYIRHRLIYTIIIILLIGSILLVLFMKTNYTPILNIHKLINTSSNSSNYLHAIEKAITSLSHENIKLNNTLSQQTILVKDNYLNQVLGGYYNTIEEFNDLTKDYSINFSYDKLFVFIIQLDDINNNIINNEMINSLELFIQNRINAYFIRNNFDIKSLIFISSYKDESSLETYFKEIKDYINEVFKVNCTIGIGNTVTTPNKLKASLIEAKTSCQYCYVKANNEIIYYKKINYTNNNIDFYPIKLFENISNAIHLKDINEVHRNIDILCNNIKASNQPLYILKFLSYELISIVIKQTYELNIYDQLVQHNVFNITSLFECNDIDELIISIKKACNYICQYMKQATDYKNNNTTNKFINYIHENCFLYDFSINKMSTFFNISQSSLSQQFKHYTGNTISHYVDNLRIEKAKLLLKTTQLPIKDIIVQIGYCDSSSFTRKFKQMVGMTPGKYRALYKK
jgi:AraC-like DNA-binding protein